MFHTDLTPFGVDMERLTKQRLERLQQAMKQQGLGALMLTDHQNIRYATNSVFMLGLRATAIQRFVLVPASGAPLICQKQHESEGSRHALAPICSACAHLWRPKTSLRKRWLDCRSWEWLVNEWAWTVSIWKQSRD